MIFWELDYLTSIFSIIIGYRVLNLLLPIRFNNKQTIGYEICFSILLSLIICILNIVELPVLLTLLFCIIFFTVTSIFLYSTKMKFIFSFVSFYFSTILLCNSVAFVITNAINNYNGWNTYNHSTSYIFIIYIIRITEIIIFYLFYKTILKKYDVDAILTKYKYFLSIAILGLVTAYFVTKKSFIYVNQGIVSSWIAFIILGILTLFLIILFFTNYEKEEEKKIIEFKNKMLQEDFVKMRELYENNAKTYHDLNNHMTILYKLIKGGKSEQALDYINNISKPILSNYGQNVFTNNTIVDFVINNKLEIIKEEKIQNTIEVEIPQKLKIADNDIVAILSNLIDNAIEACQHIEQFDKRWIKITIKKINEMIFLKIENSISIKPKLLNNHFLTTKKDKKFHGWGLKSVTSIVNKYEGYIRYEYTNKSFNVVISLSDIDKLN
ncbi:GHKL domain-containing protein [Bacillus sp. S13(2024)]|uniref:sensor histidine kinase n=1 Tax=unclassified Bacillus (in: firmicutes) TaxID=185979 RepID=UPI003D1A447D